MLDSEDTLLGKLDVSSEDDDALEDELVSDEYELTLVESDEAEVVVEVVIEVVTEVVLVVTDDSTESELLVNNEELQAERANINNGNKMLFFILFPLLCRKDYSSAPVSIH